MPVLLSGDGYAEDGEANCNRKLSTHGFPFAFSQFVRPS